jgi:hypothetical protein
MDPVFVIIKFKYARNEYSFLLIAQIYNQEQDTDDKRHAGKEPFGGSPEGDCAACHSGWYPALSVAPAGNQIPGSARTNKILFKGEMNGN